MKIVEKTADRLRLSASPWLMTVLFAAIVVTMLAAAVGKQRDGASNEAGVLFLFAFAVLIGGVFICAFVRLTLDRSSGRVTYSRFTLRGWQERDWALADRIRDELKDQGVVLEDAAGGTTWRRA